MNVNGSTNAAVMGWAASALGMMAVIATPKAVKHTMPASSARPRPGSVEPRTWVPNATQPMARVTTASSNMANVEDPSRPAM